MPEYCYRCPEDDKKVAIGKSYTSKTHDPIQPWAAKKYFGDVTDVHGKTIQCCLNHVSPPAYQACNFSKVQIFSLLFLPLSIP